MKVSKTVILIYFLACLTSLELYSQTPPLTSVGTVNYDGTSFSVPITVQNFNNVGNISLRLEYNAACLIYTGVTLNSGLVSENSLSTPLSDQSGKFSFSYTSSSTIVLNSPSDVLLTITFNSKPGIKGVHTLLTWSTLQGNCDMTPPSPGTFTPEITVSNMMDYFTNGVLNIPPEPQIAGPQTSCITSGVIYSTEPGMIGYQWTISSGGTIDSGEGTNLISVTWNNVGPQTISVTYSDPYAGPAFAPVVFPVNTVACSNTLVLNFYLQGLYTGGGKMRQVQGDFGNQFSGNTADVFSVELHDAINYSSILFSTDNVNLSTDGVASVTIPDNLAGNYYISIVHRNSIATTSADPVSFISSPVTYNFTDQITRAYGSNLAYSAGVYLIYCGDINQDGIIDLSDLILVETNAVQAATGYIIEDVNGDGLVDLSDLIIVGNNASLAIGVITP